MLHRLVQPCFVLVSRLVGRERDPQVSRIRITGKSLGNARDSLFAVLVACNVLPEVRGGGAHLEIIGPQDRRAVQMIQRLFAVLGHPLGEIILEFGAERAKRRA